MKITITANTPLREIIAAFSQAWPHLRLAFYTRPHAEHRGTDPKFSINNLDQTVEATTGIAIQPVLFDITESMSVWEVEQLFEKDLGLHVNIFRHSGNVWLQTTVSDRLTLRQQEERGVASDHPVEPDAEIPDYREIE